MIPEFGHIALMLALCLALIQSIFPFFSRARWLGIIKFAAYGQCFFLCISFVCLASAFLHNDFSIAYVAANSNTQLPAMYQIAAIWGAHEGSLLLWVLLLSGWTVAVGCFSKQLPPEMLAKILAILGMISVGFLIFLLTTSNPFDQLSLWEIPLEGRDLNPLLQDPGLASHPPMLYMGYVGFSVAFAFAIAALLGGKLDAKWARWTRPWTLLAWSSLTLGITLGSWWAYRVLGWGGWWFWDPVENASLLPWLVGTALVHSLIVTEKRGMFKGWTVLLAICAFSLSLMGTFLVRSGILTSVHAFANDPARGAFMLKFLLVVVGGSLFLYALRAAKLRSRDIVVDWLSKETLLLANNVILMTIMVTVLLGTLYPLILEVLDLGKISVGPPYFNAVFLPLAVPLFLLMGMAPYGQWQRTNPSLLLKQLRYILLASVLAGILIPLIYSGKVDFYAALGVTLAGWIIFATGQNLWQRLNQPGSWRTLSHKHYGMVIAHVGVAVCIIGITFTSAYHQERELRMAEGETVQVAGYAFQFLGVKDLQGPNYKGVTGVFQVTERNADVTRLYAEKRIYNAQQTVITQAAVDPGLWRDLYVALGEPLENDAWAVRIYYKPFVRWIWCGGLFMMLGGLFSVVTLRRSHKL